MVNPMAMGLRLAGTVEFAGLKAPPQHGARRRPAASGGQQLFPHLDTSSVTRWMGHRPCHPDSLPWLVQSARPTMRGWPSATATWHVHGCGDRPRDRASGRRTPDPGGPDAVFAGAIPLKASWSLAVDMGGTFVDAVALRSDGHITALKHPRADAGWRSRSSRRSTCSARSPASGPVTSAAWCTAPP